MKKKVKMKNAPFAVGGDGVKTMEVPAETYRKYFGLSHELSIGNLCLRKAKGRTSSPCRY